MSRRGRGSDRRKMAVNAEINVTSLVDVAFTLLVIFIITAPILQGGISVDVPQSQVRPLTAEEESARVTIRSEGVVFLGETEWELSSLEAEIGDLAAAQGWESIYIKADSASKWNPVNKVMAAVSASGLKMHLVSEPYPNR